MARKKIEENHEILTEDFTEETAFDGTDESDSVYDPDMAPLAKETDSEVPVADSEEKAGKFIVLRKGASFTTGAYVFIKNIPVPVDSYTAEKLMATGFFERC